MRAAAAVGAEGADAGRPLAPSLQGGLCGAARARVGDGLPGAPRRSFPGWAVGACRAHPGRWLVRFAGRASGVLWVRFGGLVAALRSPRCRGWCSWPLGSTCQRSGRGGRAAAGALTLAQPCGPGDVAGSGEAAVSNSQDFGRSRRG